MKVTFDIERMTKNTIRFSEVLTDALDVPKVGTIYVPKTTLKEIGYAEGKQLVIDLAVK